MKAERNRVGVIGSGLAGLASACVLAARGYAVTVFEKSPWLGGKAAVLEEAGFQVNVKTPRPAESGGEPTEPR